MITAPTVTNLVRNAAYTIKTGKIHEPAVLRTSHALRTGPLVVTEFDGLSILADIVISEVKKRAYEQDISRLIEEISHIYRDLNKRLKYIKNISRKRVRSKIVVFHNIAIDAEYLKKRFEDIEIVTIPFREGKLPPSPPEERLVNLLIRAQIIEFLSLPRLTCEKLRSAISCSSPPLDAIIEDLRKAANNEDPDEFSRRLSDQAADPERLSRLHPCQALYSVNAALRTRGRREAYQEVLERYADAIEYIFGLPFMKPLARIANFMAHSVLHLVAYLETGEGSVIMPRTPQRQQDSIRLCCLEEFPKRVLVLLGEDYVNETRVLTDLLLTSFELEEIYAIDNYVYTTLAYNARNRGLRTKVFKVLIKPNNVPEEVLRTLGSKCFDVVSTDLFLSYKRNRRLMRTIEDLLRPYRVLVLHRGVIPPSVERRHAKGRHSLEVM